MISGASAESLNDVLARMDRSSDTFQGMTAKLSQVNHTEVINENETVNATVKLHRSKTGLTGRVDFSGPNQKIVSVDARKVRVYYPKSNLVELYDVGKYGNQLDQFLLLGFGTSGQELKKNYQVRLIGSETIAGKPTTHLELTPKSKEAKDIFKKADLWLAQDADYPLQEKIHKNDQDYTLITYSDVKLNPALADKELELVLPPGVKQVTPQK
jgi:outer membrane lipoprotein-sorting protein